MDRRKNYTSSINSSTVNTLPPRHVYVNIRLPDTALDSRAKATGRYVPSTTYASNKVITAKYSLLTFIPKNLFEQFRRVANSFFLLIIILQCFPEFKTIDVGVAALPFIIIVFVTALKDGVEDYRRWVSDKTINARPTKVLNRKQWHNVNYPEDTTLVSLRCADRILLVFKLRRKRSSAADEAAGNGSKEVYTWQDTKWQDVRVGDIIYMENDENVPADILILSTSEPDCICYVETKNLDGETNLKLRQGITETMWVKTTNDCATNLRLVVESEPPTTNMIRYQASAIIYPTNYEGGIDKSASIDAIPVSLESAANPTKKVPLDVNALLLRGCVVRNTKWIIGVVIMTGEDTKQILNSGTTPSKRSELEILMNPHIAANLLIMAVLCLVPALAPKLPSNTPYTSEELSRGKEFDGFINFWWCMILFQNVIPISLYISIEIVKTIQAYFIHTDLQLYYEENDTPCTARSWNLSDNLGQIEYIFSDKTGTLTRNIMEFKKCSINGTIFDGSGRAHMKQNDSCDNVQRFASSPVSPTRSIRSLVSVRAAWVEGVHEIDTTRSNLRLTSPEKSPHVENRSGWHDPQIDKVFEKENFHATSSGRNIGDFFLLLGICHTVLVDCKTTTRNAESHNGDVEEIEFSEISYKAQSPDEACLVTLAAETGFVFKGREINQQTGRNEIVINILGNEARFGLFNVLEFDSDRKRMSVIVRAPNNSRASLGDSKGEILLFCKGADNVIFERLAPGQDDLVKKTTSHLEEFAQEGLRTLCLAYRKIPTQTFEEWTKRYSEALTVIYPDPRARSKALDKLHEEMENNMTLLGATAIEDKLQDGVPECITTLASAGIKIWVLTGDKMETAINVGFLCGLLKTSDSNTSAQSGMTLIQVKEARDDVDIIKQLDDALRLINETGGPAQEFALIIDGQSIKCTLETEQTKDLFLQIGCKCKAVICCRVSPLQKAKVVDMVKRGKNVLTLAIGDGANDVSMIQAADVGVGISGEEGLQAAMSSDYAIAQFRFLKRMLLVHGRWSYSRLSLMILNFYLKNIVFSVILFWYQFYCGFSGDVIYEFTYMLFYNLFFTGIPTIALAIFDRNLSEEVLDTFPAIYGKDGITHSMYTHKLFGLYVLEGFWQSLVCYFIPLYAYSEGVTNITGRDMSRLHIGTVMALSSICAANFSVAIDTNSWTWINHFATWGSSALIFLYILVYSNIMPSIYGMYHELYGEPMFWLVYFLSIYLSNGPRMMYYALVRMTKPTDKNILEEIQKLLGSGDYDLEQPPPSRPVSEKKARSVISQRRLSIDSRNGRPSVERKPRLSMDVSSANSANRRLSQTSMVSVNYDPETQQKSNPLGFSFSHTKGMGSVVMKSSSPIENITEISPSESVDSAAYWQHEQDQERPGSAKLNYRPKTRSRSEGSQRRLSLKVPATDDMQINVTKSTIP